MIWNRGRVLKSIATKQYKRQQWADLLVSDAERIKCVDVIFDEKKLQSRAYQVLSNERNNRKRKETFLISFFARPNTTVCCRDTSYIRKNSKEQKQEKLGRQILCFYVVSPTERGILVSEGELASLSFFLAELESSIFSNNLLASTDVLPIFAHVIGDYELHEYMGYVPRVVSTLQDATSYIDSTVLALPQMDAFILTGVYWLCDDGVDEVGGHYQKLYPFTFSSFSIVSFNQFIGTVAKFVLLWCPEMVEVFFSKATLARPLFSFCLFAKRQ